MVNDCPSCPKIQCETSFVQTCDGSASSKSSGEDDDCDESDGESKTVFKYFKWATDDSKVQSKKFMLKSICRRSRNVYEKRYVF